MFTKSATFHPFFITKTFRKYKKFKKIPSKSDFYISQHFKNTKCSKFWKLPDISFLEIIFNIFKMMMGPKQSSISIILNKNGKNGWRNLDKSLDSKNLQNITKSD